MKKIVLQGKDGSEAEVSEAVLEKISIVLSFLTQKNGVTISFSLDSDNLKVDHVCLETDIANKILDIILVENSENKNKRIFELHLEYSNFPQFKNIFSVNSTLKTFKGGKQDKTFSMKKYFDS
jgi:hypothetical protein